MKKILILSGAGLSAPSGIKTFRDSNGLWENYDVLEVCSADGFRINPKKVLNFYDARRADLINKKPNEAHLSLAKLKNKYPNNIIMMTQNVDDLLERAKCKDVIHLHGTLRDLWCLDCDDVFDIGYESYQDKICPSCKSKNIRHNVVMFGESAPKYLDLNIALKEANCFVCIGTSGQVLDVGYFARKFQISLLNNLEKDMLHNSFSHHIYESADIAAPKIFEFCENFLKGDYE